MATDAAADTQGGESSTTTTVEPTADMSPRERALAAAGSFVWDGDDAGTDDDTGDADPSEGQPETPPIVETEETDELAAYAKKIEARRTAEREKAQAAKGATFDTEAFLEDMPGYLKSLGLDGDALVEALADSIIEDPKTRAAKAQTRELEKFRAAEKLRAEHAQLTRAAQADQAMNESYHAFVTANAETHPRLAALDSHDRLRYTEQVAQMVVDAGEDAGETELARLTELHLSKLARKLIPGVGTGTTSKAEVGDRTKLSVDSDAPRTITTSLTSESGTPPERDLSPEGRRAAALRKAASLGL